MDTLLNLKRPHGTCISYSLCIICQEHRQDTVFAASEKGIARLKEASIERHKHQDVWNLEPIDRINEGLESGSSIDFVWHKSCYAKYTDKGKIKRLEKKCSDTSPLSSTSNLDTASVQTEPRLRRSTEKMDWNLCIFCQDISASQSLSCISTFNTSRTILDAATCDPQLHVRLSTVNDLIAAEGKYHTNCYKKFIRNTTRVKNESNDIDDMAMVWLVQELKAAAAQGHVLEISEVWNRYSTLTTQAGQSIPQSLVSRKQTFKEKILPYVGDVYDFIFLRNHAIENRQTILVPKKYRHIPMSETSESSLNIPVFNPPGDDFLSIVHLALKLRSDINSQAKYSGFNVTEDEAIACVPESLYTFLRVLLGGQSTLEADDDADPINAGVKESEAQTRVLSIAQDIIYSASGGQKWTPKHVGLASTLHQSTRSKQLVELFHKADHIIGYKDVLKLDNALAETLTTMNQENGAVIPPNLTQDRFIHFSADNIDINDGTLDGKNTFHATQFAAWQRGPYQLTTLKDIVPTTHATLEVPEIMNAIFPAPSTVMEPHFEKQVELEWFSKTTNESPQCVEAKATDHAFFMMLANSEITSWSSFNERRSQTNPEVTTIGYMPIIQAPAHELDTMNTVVMRALHVANRIGQKFIVITVDQALFPLLMQLKWSVPEYKHVLIPRLGGLHIAMNFLKVIGKHMQDSGLKVVWIESNLFGENTTEQIMAGKDYPKGTRAHKITLQAMWQLLLPQLLDYLHSRDKDLHERISNAIGSGTQVDIDELIRVLASDTCRSRLSDFVKDNEARNSNFQFWWQYMEMVGILLLFIRAQRDSMWDLHVQSFGQMLPYFHRYHHTNYARWGSIYLAQMNQLPTTVQDEFKKGNWVVKGSLGRFNQVDPDHSQEWLNGTGKRGGGIVGIIKTMSALSRWTLSYNLRSEISASTREMFQLGLDDQFTRNEANPSRKRRDRADQSNVLQCLQRFKLFSPDTTITNLHNIATKDLATDEIEKSLLNAKHIGQKQLNDFKHDRLMPATDGRQHGKLQDPLKKNRPLTFASLYSVEKQTKDKDITIKADRNILMRLIMAYDAGRSVDLAIILKHELMPVPVSLAELNGELRGGNKSAIIEVFTGDIKCATSVTIEDSSCLIIDGQARVLALGKPNGCVTFGDLADVFVQSVLQSGHLFDRIDITFDRYRKESIKSGTRRKRSKGQKPIRKVVEDRTTPLPYDFSNLLGQPQNKADLAQLLSEELVTQAPIEKTIVVSGGFQDEQSASSSNTNLDVSELEANHEEADTRIILHCMHTSAKSVVVLSHDSDVLVLLVAHFNRFPCKKLWMKTGTSTKPRYIPIHTICENLSSTLEELTTILAFHAITGCDTVSHNSGHGKKSAWKVFCSDPNLLANLGVDTLTPMKIKSAEKFVCKMYNLPDEESSDKARVVLFGKSRLPEALPPTSDALQFHIQRAHYQTKVWRQATQKIQTLPSPELAGWTSIDGRLIPTLMSRSPIPDICTEAITCGCTTGCNSNRCSCRKASLSCTKTCRCGG